VLKQAGVEVEIKRVPEILPDEIISRMGALEARKAFEHIPIAEPTELGDYDGIILVLPHAME
jgi:NAD(P)H dehydrogenase (quinone)